MTNDLIREHINILVKDLKTIDCNFSINILTQSINDAILNDDFYNINYEKYAKTIIDNSKIPLNQKESLHQVFIRNKFNKVIKCKSCGKPIEDIIQLSPEISEEYHKKNKENFVKQLFANPLKNINIVDGQSSDPLITPDVIQDSIPIKRPFEYFIPTIKYQFDKNPSEIDFDKLRQKLGDEVLIINVEKGCTILQIAFLNELGSGGNVNEKMKKAIQRVDNIFSTMGKAIVGNIQNEEITLPDEQKMQEFYDKGSSNLLQNTYKLRKIDIEDIKKQVLSEAKEISKKNWNFIFQHEDIFENAEKQIRNDIKTNEFEMIIIGQTVIANKYIKEFEELKNTIPKENQKVVFLYHGTKFENQLSIVQKNFLVPKGEDESEWKRNAKDLGYFGKGIYATDNMFYAAKYSYGYNNEFVFNERTHIFCCMAVYNDEKVEKITNDSYRGKEINEDIANSCGVYQAFVGDYMEFWPIEEDDIQYSYLIANEFVFANKYQIIPVYSFTVMRKDHFILWIDENLESTDKTKLLKELQERMEVNVYFAQSMDEGLEIIQRKKKNKIKLITNSGYDFSGKKLIEEARKIIGSNFVCMVFASSIDHIKWVSKMENVLFTMTPEHFREFAAMELDQKDIIEFAHRLEDSYEYKVNINEDELLNFPTSLKSHYFQ